MKTRMLVSVALALTTAVVACAAEPPACKLKIDDDVGAFKVTKSGGVDDGVEVGKSLCYL